MNLSGLAGIPGGRGGGDTAGMSDQEAAMVKAVRDLPKSSVRSFGLLTGCIVDASWYGELPCQINNIRWNGLCTWGDVWTVHG